MSVDTQLMKLHMLLHCWPREGAQGQLSVSAECTCQHRKICSAQYVCTSPHAILLCASGVTICVMHDTAQSMLTLTPVASELSIQLRKQLALYKSLLCLQPKAAITCYAACCAGNGCPVVNVHFPRQSSLAILFAWLMLYASCTSYAEHLSKYAGRSVCWSMAGLGSL